MTIPASQVSAPPLVSHVRRQAASDECFVDACAAWARIEPVSRATHRLALLAWKYILENPECNRIVDAGCGPVSPALDALVLLCQSEPHSTANVTLVDRSEAALRRVAVAEVLRSRVSRVRADFSELSDPHIAALLSDGPRVWVFSQAVHHLRPLQRRDLWRAIAGSMSSVLLLEVCGPTGNIRGRPPEFIARVQEFYDALSLLARKNLPSPQAETVIGNLLEPERRSVRRHGWAERGEYHMPSKGWLRELRLHFGEVRAETIVIGEGLEAVICFGRPRRTTA